MQQGHEAQSGPDPERPARRVALNPIPPEKLEDVVLHMAVVLVRYWEHLEQVDRSSVIEDLLCVARRYQLHGLPQPALLVRITGDIMIRESNRRHDEGGPALRVKSC